MEGMQNALSGSRKSGIRVNATTNPSPYFPMIFCDFHLLTILMAFFWIVEVGGVGPVAFALRSRWIVAYRSANVMADWSQTAVHPSAVGMSVHSATWICLVDHEI